MKPLSIVVTLAAAVLVVAIGWMLGPGASWWLEHVDGVTGLQGEKLAAAVDAVRGRALAVATGLAALAAVYYTARNADTARRTFQLGERGHDTDRYSKAVEQLGSVQAPVRLGGLHALKQLAQDNPHLRQTVVDVFSAYLRMPYTPPEDVDRGEKLRAAQRAARNRKAEHSGPPARDSWEERQVRLTAQRILTDHLRWLAPRQRRRWSRAERPPDTFWPGIRLDLTGATLLNADFRNCQIAQATFDGATFTGDARFDRTAIDHSASFNNATFTDDARFDRTTFGHSASFNNATFTDVRFDKATFNSDASFGGVTFTGLAQFDDATFSHRAWFPVATFTDASFDGAIFTDAWFVGATFTGGASFDGVTFTQTARFDAVTFTHGATFDAATFTRGATFQERILSRVSLEGAQVLAFTPDDQWWQPGWRVEPNGQGGGILRRDSSPHADTGHKPGREGAA
ncbi:pentapeptide repeat-containing protein [Nonomuraea polychroma]|uniref:pentapeptide repeat-containing protein n=1 Tax=Nonomuraea polychroma TaxID=46176 RepID=UPI003D91A014